MSPTRRRALRGDNASAARQSISRAETNRRSVAPFDGLRPCPPISFSSAGSASSMSFLTESHYPHLATDC